ncbi:MAG TPA: hypothetical protein VJT73_17245, partial [Polyangiaceae bacterium]|nr:hypothetical protein [Polyangiaceae bacterium]
MSLIRTLSRSKTGSMALAALAVMTVGAVAQGLDYNYVGSNYVMQSGSSCRAESRSLEQSRGMQHNAGNVTSNYGTSATRVFCPVQRRSVSYYGGATGSATNEAGLNIPGSTWVRVRKGSSSMPLSCTPFIKDLTTGALQLGETRFLCSAPGGCYQNPSSYSGENGLELLWPVVDTLTMNYGFYCDLKGTDAEVQYSVT